MFFIHFDVFILHFDVFVLEYGFYIKNRMISFNTYFFVFCIPHFCIFVTFSTSTSISSKSIFCIFKYFIHFYYYFVFFFKSFNKLFNDSSITLCILFSYVCSIFLFHRVLVLFFIFFYVVKASKPKGGQIKF